MRMAWICNRPNPIHCHMPSIVSKHSFIQLNCHEMRARAHLNRNASIICNCLILTMILWMSLFDKYCKHCNGSGIGRKTKSCKFCRGASKYLYCFVAGVRFCFSFCRINFTSKIVSDCCFDGEFEKIEKRKLNANIRAIHWECDSARSQCCQDPMEHKLRIQSELFLFFFFFIHETPPCASIWSVGLTLRRCVDQ